ncbi:hypothetical protein [Gordonia rubripertincta]|uniref:hypothetical protein n=1 Tax=Gordonia rubripertincta TaxID=36822 RepID=UPI000B8D4EA0|nr:hypothetical protein [Gordonia rubripertincta]ASR05622.1 hypothetical protein GCWB2_24255 [Gordonia rubripertincta]
MASKTKATQALDAYRREILSNTVETRIAELSEVVATYEATCRDRDRQARTLTSRSWWTDDTALRETFDLMQSLARRQWAVEDEVLSAFEAAKAAGAKPSVLASIGLRPDAALAAARARQSPVPPPTAASPASTEANDPAPVEVPPEVPEYIS